MRDGSPWSKNDRVKPVSFSRLKTFNEDKHKTLGAGKSYAELYKTNTEKFDNDRFYDMIG